MKKKVPDFLQKVTIIIIKVLLSFKILTITYKVFTQNVRKNFLQP